MKQSLLRIQNGLIVISFLAILISLFCLFSEQHNQAPSNITQIDSSFVMVCGNAPRTKATQEILNGEALFKENCKTCHSLVTTEVGPALRNVLDRRSEEWTKQFIRNSQKLISKKDPYAIKITKAYGMKHIQFESLTDKEMNDLFEYFKWER